MVACLRLSIARALRVATLLAMFGGEFQFHATAATPSPKAACPVTLPNGSAAGNLVAGTNYSDGQLASAVEPGGVVLVTPSGGDRPGGPYGVKWLWWQFIPGQLTVTGRRLDGPADKLTARVPDDGSEPHTVGSAVYFPVAGCWEITGQIGDHSLSVVALVVVISEPPFGLVQAETSPAASPGSCVPTLPNGKSPAKEPAYARWHQEGDLWAMLPLNGSEQVNRNFTLPDGVLEASLDWWRGSPGVLKIEGRRLDGPAPALEAVIPDIQTDVGHQPSELFFPTAGCWQVIGRLGNTTLNVTMLVTSVP